MRYPHICPLYCNHRSTRRWNLDVHIKRKHGEYLVGRSLGQHMANNLPLYSNNVRLGHATVADSIGSTLQLRSQQTHLGTSQYTDSSIYPPMDVSQTFADEQIFTVQIRMK